MGQNFDQAKCDNTFWPRPNILTGSVVNYVREREFSVLIFYFSFFYSKVTKDGKNLEMLLLSIFIYILLKEEP